MNRSEKHCQKLAIASTNRYPQTICWDCANATGNCNWSCCGRPVDGWQAIKVPPRNYGGGRVVQSSYIVQACPLFRRDAKHYGNTKTAV